MLAPACAGRRRADGAGSGTPPVPWAAGARCWLRHGRVQSSRRCAAAPAVGGAPQMEPRIPDV